MAVESGLLEADATAASAAKADSRAAHFAAFVAQVSMGSGAVIGKLGVVAFNPFLFALLREAFAVPVFVLLHVLSTGQQPRLPARHLKEFICMGLALASNQACFILGIKLTSPVTASAWQLTQPIMALGLGVLLGRERLTLRRGVAFAFGILGSLVLVLGGHGTLAMRAWGNVMFFFNCLGTVVYLLISKPLLQLYPPTVITSGAYTFAAACMLLLNVGVNSDPAIWEAFCPDCKSAWHVPYTAALAIAYWVLVVTVCGYFFITVANKSLHSSTVAFYTCCQPLTSATLSAGLIALHFNPGNALELPGWNILGAVGILLGLLLVTTEP